MDVFLIVRRKEEALETALKRKRTRFRIDGPEEMLLNAL